MSGYNNYLQKKEERIASKVRERMGIEGQNESNSNVLGNNFRRISLNENTRNIITVGESVIGNEARERVRKQERNEQNFQEIAMLEKMRKGKMILNAREARNRRRILMGDKKRKRNEGSSSRNKKLKEQLNLFPGLDQSVDNIKAVQRSIENLLEDINNNGRFIKKT